MHGTVGHWKVLALGKLWREPRCARVDMGETDADGDRKNAFGVSVENKARHGR